MMTLAFMIEVKLGGIDAGTTKLPASTLMMADIEVEFGGIHAGTMRTLAIMKEVELGGIDAGTMKLPASTLEVLVEWVLAPP